MRWASIQTRVAEVFLEVLPKGEGPSWPHPEGKTWGVVRDDGEWLVYAGRVCAVVAPGSLVRAKAAVAAVEI